MPAPTHSPRLALRLLACGLSAALTASVSPAWAYAAAPAASEKEPVDTEARAMRDFEAGKDAYAAGEYRKALDLFLDAQSLYPSPIFHYNIAKCYEALANYEQAIISYEAYLRAFKIAYGEEPEDRINTENKIERMHRLVEEEEKAGDQPNEPPPIVPPVEQGPTDSELEREAAAKKAKGLIIAGGVLTGVGVAVAAGGGAIFGNQAAGFSDQLDAVYDGGNPESVTLEDARTIDESGRAAELNQILMISIGGAVALTGIALLVVGVAKRGKLKKGGSAEQARRTRPTLAPMLGAGSSGVTISGRF